MMSYTNWNVRAIISLDPKGAADFLLELLNEPDYTSDAVAALINLACKLEIKPGFSGKREYERIWDARRGVRLCELVNEDRSRYAEAIKDAVKLLSEECQRTGQTYDMQFKELAKGLAVIDGIGSHETILRLLHEPIQNHQWRIVDALEAMVFNGVVLPKAEIFQILDDMVAGIGPYAVNDNEFGFVLNSLCLLPFIDDPSAGIEKMREILGRLRIEPYQIRGVVIALGHSRNPGALTLLRELAVDQPHLSAIEDLWITAVARLDSSEARETLLNFVNPDATEFPFASGLAREDILAARLRDLAVKDRAFELRVLALCSRQLDPIKRSRLGGIIKMLGTERAALAGLNLIDDSAPQTIPYGIGKLVEELFVEHVPDGEATNSYTLVPRTANTLRSRLVEMAKSDYRRKRSATSLIAQIELWRLEHGRPLGESRSLAVAQESSLPMVPVSRLQPEG